MIRPTLTATLTASLSSVAAVALFGVYPAVDSLPAMIGSLATAGACLIALYALLSPGRSPRLVSTLSADTLRRASEPTLCGESFLKNFPIYSCH